MGSGKQTNKQIKTCLIRAVDATAKQKTTLIYNNRFVLALCLCSYQSYVLQILLCHQARFDRPSKVHKLCQPARKDAIKFSQ